MILATLDDVKDFAAATRCPECKKDAEEMIACWDLHDAGDSEIEFATECPHQ